MNEQKRRIFISDIHMGIGEGLVRPHPYNWLRKDRADMLTHFLNSLKDDNTVDELVVVGDLFDEWVMPFAVKSPAEGDVDWFAKIVELRENSNILNALSELTKRAKVRYVHGNHDMQMTRKILACYAQGVKWVPGNPGLGTYIDDGIHAEHGSLYCLFNAPYLLSTHKQNQIPIGYFMARSNAQFISKGGSLNWEEYLKIFFDIAMELLKGKKLAQALVIALAEGMNINPDDTVNLYGVDSFDSKTTTIRKMAHLLGNIYDEWDNEWKKVGIQNVSALSAIYGDTGHLYHAAKLNFSSSINLVIYGHTHKWELKGVASKDLESFTQEMGDVFNSKLKWHEAQIKINEVADKYDPGDELFEGHVYANSGTWINGTGDGKNPPPATYVEVIDNEGARTINVREYGVVNPLKSRKIYVGKGMDGLSDYPV